MRNVNYYDDVDIVTYDKYNVDTDEELFEVRRAELYEDNKQDTINLALEVAHMNFAETTKAKAGAKLNEKPIIAYAAKWFEENVIDDGELDFIERLNGLIETVAQMAKM